jgi:hypothetical protein
MGLVVKIIDDEFHLAPNFVYAPGYSIITSQVTAATVLPDGWKYIETEEVVKDLTPLWKQPDSAKTAYHKGAEVNYNDTLYRSIIDNNVWIPNVTGWIELTSSDIPSWRQPLGSHDAYSADAVVTHNGKLWKSLVADNVWEPGVANWREFYRKLSDIPVGYPIWIQPTGAQDAYQINDKVSHNGQNWNSTAANNVWEPGVYGWVVI